jgi:DnaJ-class molecular chaperone
MAQWGDTDTLADAPKFETPSISFDATDAAVVVLADDEIVKADHGLETGDRVTYTAGAAPITGLTSGTLYFVIRVDQNKFSLAANATDAGNGTAITLTGQGGGTDTIQVTPDDVFFIDIDEAAVPANRAKGLNTPGWVKYEEYGAGRKRVEVLVAMKRTAGAPTPTTEGGAGDDGLTGNTAIEDTTVADS